MTKSSRATSAVKKLVYVGPNLNGSQLLTYQVFIGGYPSYMDKEFAEKPYLKKLFVPISQLPAAKMQIQTAGTPLNLYFKKALEV